MGLERNDFGLRRAHRGIEDDGFRLYFVIQLAEMAGGRRRGRRAAVSQKSNRKSDGPYPSVHDAPPVFGRSNNDTRTPIGLPSSFSGFGLDVLHQGRGAGAL